MALSLEAQRRHKPLLVKEALARTGGIELSEPPSLVSAGESLGYRLRVRLHIDERYAGRRVAEVQPSVLLFPTITHGARSDATRLDAVQATGHLLTASGPQLFDRAHMGRHLTVLRALVGQAAAFRVRARGDALADPAGVLDRIEGTSS